MKFSHVSLVLFLILTTALFAENTDTSTAELPMGTIPFITTWRTDNPGTSAPNQITIPTFTGETYNYTVDWGDGNITTGENGNATHTYAAPGTYTVSITGTFPRIFFNNIGDRQKLLTIEQWGNNAWTSMASAFFGCTNLTITNPTIDNPNFSNLTTLGRMFEGCSNFNGNISNWDVSTVENMLNLFRGATVFNQDIGSWDVSNVQTLDRTFSNAIAFNQDISTWNVSNVTDMLLTFFNAESFNQPIQSWDVSNVIRFARMFEETDVFNQPIGVWDTSSATDMSGMFNEAMVFNQDIGAWDVSNVTLFRETFEGAISFNQDISGWDTSNATDMLFMFRDAVLFNQDISSWDVSQVFRTFAMFENATAFDQDLSAWNVANITTAERMFDGVTLSTANYDALLIGWNAQNLQPNVPFSGGNSQYCDGAAARANMIAADTWTITDGGSTSPTVDDLPHQTHVNFYLLPAITGGNLTGIEAYYTSPNGTGTRFDAGDVINYADFATYPQTLYIYDGSGACSSQQDFELTITESIASCAIADRAALIALYNATDGPNWTDNTNWNTAAPLNTWFGVTTDVNGCVIAIEMGRGVDGNNLSGTLPNEIGDLQQLERLDLSFNGPDLNGNLPTALGLLTNLEELILTDNGFTGNLITEIINLPNLAQLYLGLNDLSGSIPLGITTMSNLELLQLSNNDFSGFIYPEYSNITTLRELSLGGNQLTGTIPIELGTLPNLEILSLGFQNITGNIPTELGNIATLIQLNLRSASLEGNIPNSLLGLNRLEQLFLDNNQLEGTIPDFTGLANLRLLFFGNNRFQFGDFETEHPAYTMLNNYNNNPQSKVNLIENPNRNAGDNITLSTTVSGAQNHYKWFKDGVEIIGAPDSPDLNLTNLQVADAGVYHCEITSDIVTDLILVRNDITLSIGACVITADNPEDVNACGSYILPELSENNAYFTETNAGGMQLRTGDEITTSQTIYVYVGTAACSDENSFVVTIDAPAVVDAVEDVTECESYTLPVLANGNYFTEAGGLGNELFTGDLFTTSQTIFVYFQSGTCTDEDSFLVTIDPTICEEEEEEEIPVNNECVIQFPKFFTPNGDGINDTFRVMDNTCEFNGEIRIFDRYGKLVFQSRDLSLGWNGTLNGTSLPASDYWYQYIDGNTEQMVTKHFALKR